MICAGNHNQSNKSIQSIRSYDHKIKPSVKEPLKKPEQVSIFLSTREERRNSLPNIIESEEKPPHPHPSLDSRLKSHMGKSGLLRENFISMPTDTRIQQSSNEFIVQSSPSTNHESTAKKKRRRLGSGSDTSVEDFQPKKVKKICKKLHLGPRLDAKESKKPGKRKKAMTKIK